MNRSYSKIRHIQDANVLLESRVLSSKETLLTEGDISQARVTFFDNLASQISTKIIGKTIPFGQIGVMDGSSVIVKSYEDRNHAIDLKGQTIDEFNLYFKVRRDKEDLYPNEKAGTRVWTGMLGITATYKNGVISASPSLVLYGKEKGTTDDYDYANPIDATSPVTWDKVGGKDLWSKATNAKNL